MTHEATETTTSSTPQPSAKEVVEAFIGALERLDLDAAIALVSDDVRWVNYPLTTARNKKQFGKALRGMFRDASRFEVQYNDIHERDDGVVYTDRIDIFEGGGFSMDLPVEGELRVREGRVVAWTDRFSWRKVVGDIAKSLPSIVRYRLGR